jgi:hypothetical protein
MKSFLNIDERAEILQRLSRVRPDSRRKWGKMTPHQMVCHLCDSLRFSLGERDAESVENIFTRTVMKWVALYTPLPWPHGIPTMATMDQQAGGTPPIEFDRDKQEFQVLMDRFLSAPSLSATVRHPFFGEMSEFEWKR